ncbi:MAG: glycosyltransferase [Algoriphagus sp.]|uniref:glycosyltransferase family 2 protein n=1 Tax=Algoriphagus sp. TaxID=1872435 RepID=UPI0018049CAD|nr:glycosyltransferase family 2 protein [Algoriphagus sp.]NVJ86810.1 glycosyltransferase [Algoriphagus sp.]
METQWKVEAKFSIIVPTLNSGKYLERLLSSLINQNFSEFEILVMDGVSTDNTLEIINSFKDKRIEIYSSPDKGVYDAMNKGISAAKGEWVYFIGADDWLYDKHTLDKVYKRLLNTSCHVAYGDVLIHGDSDWAKDQEVYAGEFDSFRLTKKNICHQGIFYRRSFLNKNQLFFDLQYPINSDWDFNLRCISITKFLYLNLIIANFSSGGLSTNAAIYDSIFEDIPLKYYFLFPSKWKVFISKVKKILNN